MRATELSMENVLERAIEFGVLPPTTQIAITYTGSKSGSFYYIQEPNGGYRTYLGQGAKEATNTLYACTLVGIRCVAANGG